MIDIIAAVYCNKNDFEFMRGHLINLLLFCLAQAVLHSQMILQTHKNIAAVNFCESAKHKFTRSAIMPFCITRNRLWLLFNFHLNSTTAEWIQAIRSTLRSYLSSSTEIAEVYLTSIPEGVVYESQDICTMVRFSFRISFVISCAEEIHLKSFLVQRHTGRLRQR